MTESDLPWIPAAIRQLLMANHPFVESCAGRCGTRLPSDMTRPFAQVRVSGNLDLGGGGYKPLVQVDGWAAPGGTEDVEAVVWRIATRAARVLRVARNVPYESMRYSARVVDAPQPGPIDISRGADSPLYRALTRAEITLHNR